MTVALRETDCPPPLLTQGRVTVVELLVCVLQENIEQEFEPRGWCSKLGSKTQLRNKIVPQLLEGFFRIDIG